MNFRMRLFVFLLVTIPFAFSEDTETVLHHFSGGSPNQPQASLISDASGNLYGVTGVYGVGCVSNCGRVFEMSPSGSSWTFSTLHVFRGGNDGSAPQAALTMDSSGNLYGTTSTGGGTCSLQGGGCGTVFKLTRSSAGKWTETVLHRFNKTSDGSIPLGSLILDSSGNLYGTTQFSGLISSNCQFGCGMVFKLTPAAKGWTFSVIHTFTGGSDGAFGENLVMDTAGNLYGATGGGGPGNSLCGSSRCGTVFKMAPNGGSWTKTTIYTFSGSGDGFIPLSMRLGSGGVLYGAALFGGNLSCNPVGCGTVFQLKPNGSSWSFSVLHTFAGPDGENPAGVVLDSAGDLYGSSEIEGASCCGNVFELVPGAGGVWTENVLFSFTGQDDGAYPQGPPLLESAGALFGVTSNGGATTAGVVFELKP
jgi:uncharacterized repeat protein (TIGR03803 family)